MANGCAYGKVSRNMIENLSSEIKDFKDEIRGEFQNLRKTNQELYNHLSDRLPRWAIVVGGIGAILLGAFITFALNLLIRGL